MMALNPRKQLQCLIKFKILVEPCKRCFWEYMQRFFVQCKLQLIICSRKFETRKRENCDLTENTEHMPCQTRKHFSESQLSTTNQKAKPCKRWTYAKFCSVNVAILYFKKLKTWKREKIKDRTEHMLSQTRKQVSL